MERLIAVARSSITSAKLRSVVRATSVGALVTLLGLVAGGPVHAQQSILSREFTDAVFRYLPLIAASAGFTYHFDPDTGAFERETAIAGQLFVERPDPVGKGRWNLSLNYQRVKFDTVQGHDLNRLTDPSYGVLDYDLELHEFTASATYGLSENSEVNLAVPVIYSDFSSTSSWYGRTRQTNLEVDPIFLRGKYRLLQRDTVQAAAGLVVRMLTEDLLTEGADWRVQAAPMLYLSTKSAQVAPWARLRPYLNTGVNFDEDLADSEALWSIGLDCAASDRFTAALAVLGRHQFRRVKGLEIFGISEERADIYDLSIGGRVNLWRDTLIAFANAIVPLNRDGLRADVIPLAGIEATF